MALLIDETWKSDLYSSLDEIERINFIDGDRAFISAKMQLQYLDPVAKTLITLA